MPEMEIQLGPVSRPDGPDHDPAAPPGGPDLLSVGPDPDRPDRGSWRRLPERWRRRLPESWRRPVPRWLVAVSSAVVAAVAVAAYLGGPVPAATDPPQTAPLLVPESWLDVTDVENLDGTGPGPADGGPLLGPDGPPDRRIARAIARHPADAIAVHPLRLFQARLVALPPGAYQVRASCEVAELPESLPDPLPVTVSLGNRERIPYADGEGICDGQLWTVGEPAVIDGYQAAYVDCQPAFPLLPTDGIDPHFELEQAGVLVVISITPVG